MTEQHLPVDFSFVLASSVHDMKNSVGMLMQTLEQISASLSPQDPQQRDQLAVLGYEAARINGELIQLLALYRMENKRMLVQIDEHYLDEIINEQLARNDILFRSRSIDVEVDCPEDVCWYLDAELLGSVVNNLLVNAARYCKSRIKIAAAIVNDELHLVIADDGRGYPDFMLKEPMATSNSVSFSQGNTNLGLLFAGEIARLHRRGEQVGRIELANQGLLPGGEIRVILP